MRPKRFCVAAITCSANSPICLIAWRCSRSVRRKRSADRLVYGVKELSREDRPIDVFSPSGVLGTALADGHLQLAQDPTDSNESARSVSRGSTELGSKFKESAGRICAEVITPYPPGIPVISPGEEITPEVVAYLALELKAGVRMQGPYDSELRSIRVVRGV